MAKINTQIVFAGGYSSGAEAGIHAFEFDTVAGVLQACGSFSGIANPSYVALHPMHPWLYSVSEASRNDGDPSGEVWALSYERAPFGIRALNQKSTQGSGPCHLELDKTGCWLFVSNYGSGSAAVFKLGPTGALGEMTDFVQHRGSGPNAARQEGPHAHSAIVTGDNQFVIIADLGIDELVVYRFDSQNGKLAPHNKFRMPPGSGPRHMAFDPSGSWLYVANEMNSTVTVFEYDSVHGKLFQKGTHSTLPDGAPESYVADIHINSSGQRLYVSNRGHDSVATFVVDLDGALQLLGHSSCGGSWPRNFAVAPGGRFMLVANQHSNELCVLPVDITGGIGSPVSRVTVAGAACVKIG